MNSVVGGIEMTLIRFGSFEYERRDEKISADDVTPFLATSGKQVLRVAWDALAPDYEGGVKGHQLASWFVEVFNMVGGEYNGTKCIWFLERLGLLKVKKKGGWFSEEFLYVKLNF